MFPDILANGSASNGEAAVLSTLIDLLVHETPSLESLGREDLKTVAKAMVLDSLKDDLKRRVEIERIDYPAKRELFLARCGKKSVKTESTYRLALDLLDQWADRAGVHVLEMKGSQADAFIDSLVGAPSTVRIRVAAASSFFTFLERETDGRVRNPFRGTKARPVKKTKTPVVPTKEELEVIMAALTPVNQAAVVVMTEHGLRVGALAGLNIWNGRYSSTSKGKEVAGEFSEVAAKSIKKAGLDGKRPFAGLAEDSVRNALKYACGKLFHEGKIEAAYSVHDIRHFFAIREYAKDKDIYRLKVLLNHASISVTETYLRGLRILL